MLIMFSNTDNIQYYPMYPMYLMYLMYLMDSIYSMLFNNYLKADKTGNMWMNFFHDWKWKKTLIVSKQSSIDQFLKISNHLPVCLMNKMLKKVYLSHIPCVQTLFLTNKISGLRRIPVFRVSILVLVDLAHECCKKSSTTRKWCNVSILVLVDLAHE